MSEYVTWEICHQCGLLAAVGWVPGNGSCGGPAGNRPVEFDCRAGCQVSSDELVQAYGLPLPRTSEENRERQRWVLGYRSRRS
jgi:hypothetical protein